MAMKKFVVIGLGNFGATVAKQLSELGCSVTAIDFDKDKVQKFDSDVRTAIFADATDKEVLNNLGIDKYDCFVASTGKDPHSAILIALYLKELNAKKIIIKANSTDHAKILLKVGADEAIIPEKEMAQKLSYALARTNLVDYLPLSPEFFVAELTAPKKIVGKTLAELDLRINYNIQVVAFKHKNKERFNFIPGGQYKIEEGDTLVILGSEKDIDNLRESS